MVISVDSDEECSNSLPTKKHKPDEYSGEEIAILDEQTNAEEMQTKQEMAARNKKMLEKMKRNFD